MEGCLIRVRVGEDTVGKKTKLFLIGIGILVVAILAMVLYIYLTAGVTGLYIAFFMFIFFVAVFAYVYTEINKPPRRRYSLEELEERRAYYRRLGELKAEEEIRRRKGADRQQYNTPFNLLRRFL